MERPASPAVCSLLALFPKVAKKKSARERSFGLQEVCQNTDKRTRNRQKTFEKNTRETKVSFRAGAVLTFEQRRKTSRTAGAGPYRKWTSRPSSYAFSGWRRARFERLAETKRRFFHMRPNSDCIFRVAPGIFFAFRLGKMRIRLVSCVLRRFKRCGSFDVWNKAAARDA